jgi:hypothetical protein
MFASRSFTKNGWPSCGNLETSTTFSVLKAAPMSTNPETAKAIANK